MLKRCLLLALPAALLLLLRQHGGVIAEEDRLLEMAQACCLAVACLGHAWQARVDRAGFPLDPRVRTFLALLCLALLLRELDIDRLGASPLFAQLEQVLRAGVAAMLLLTLLLLLARMEPLWRKRCDYLHWRALTLTLAGLLVYAASWPFDKQLFPLPIVLMLFLEELVELWAGVLLVRASFKRRLEAGPGLPMLRPLT